MTLHQSVLISIVGDLKKYKTEHENKMVTYLCQKNLDHTKNMYFVRIIHIYLKHDYHCLIKTRGYISYCGAYTI